MKGKSLRATRKIGLGLRPHMRQAARKHSLLVLVVALALAGLGAAVAQPGATALAGQAVPGSYELSFFVNGPQGLQPVSSLPVCSPSACEELILKAHVTEESSGLAAQAGLVTFQ